MSRQEQVAAVLRRYADLVSAGDIEGIVALYAPTACLRDPVDGPEIRGHDAIRSWYQQSFDGNGGAIQMTLEGAVRIAGNCGAAALIAIAGGGTLRIETLDVMELDEQGLVVRMDAYWGPTNVSRVGSESGAPT